MSNAILFILVLIVLLLVFFLVKSLIDSRAFRIYLISSKNMKREQHDIKKREADSNRIKGDEVEELLRKIRLGEKVKIPVEVFDYIFSNFNDFTLISNTGEVVLIKSKE